VSDRIEILQTPNPDALKFAVPGRLVERGPYEYHAGDDLSTSPLARRLLDLSGVDMAMVADGFVTVQRTGGQEWEVLGAEVLTVLHDFLGSYEMAVYEDEVAPPDAPQVALPETETERQIVALLEEYVRPAVAEDGGEVIYRGFRDGIVQLTLRGACGTCPSSLTTLKMGVERLLQEHVPEVRGVENIAL